MILFLSIVFVLTIVLELIISDNLYKVFVQGTDDKLYKYLSVFIDNKCKLV